MNLALLQTIHSYYQFCGGMHHEENNVLQEVGKEKVSISTNNHLTPERMFWDNLEKFGWGGRWEGVQEGGDISIPMADSC